MLKLQIGKDGASYTFFQEDATATWPLTAHRDAVSSAETLADLPADHDSGVDVSESRRAVIVFSPSDFVITYSFSIYGGVSGVADDYALLDGAFLTGQSGPIIYSVDTQGIDVLYVLITAISAGDLSVYLGQVLIDDDVDSE